MKLAFTVLAAVYAVTLHVNPVEKVTQLLEKLQGEVEAEGKAEAAAYDKFACFCKDQADDKQYAIEKYEAKEALLKGQIEQKSATRAGLDEEVAEHKADIARNEEAQAKIDAVRDDERTANTDRSAQMATAISAMERAIEALQSSKEGMQDAKLNLASTWTSVKSSVILADTLGLLDDPRILSFVMKPDTAHAYSYHSNEIIATLQSLLKNFKNKRIQVDNEEMTAQQDYSMAKGARNNQVKNLKKSASEKGEASAGLSEEISAHETELQETEYAHDADSNFLQDLVGKCEQRAKDFDQRSSSRTAELSAISKAIELLKGDVSKMYGSNDLGLGQEAVSFVQRSPRGNVLRFLEQQADALKSAALTTLLVQLRDAPSPFAKVKQMIQALVTRLENEAAEEASQKAWCDEEMASTQADRDDAQRAIEGTRAKLTEKNALVAQTTEEIALLSEQIAAAQKALNEATELRNQDKEANEMTLEEAKAGLEALNGALDFLQAYYGGGGGAFLQRQKPSNAAEGYERHVSANAGADGQTVGDMAPDAGGVEGEYHGKQDEAASILGLLEVIQSDFERNIEQTTADEDKAQADYETEKDELELDISSKNDLKATKETEKETAEIEITEAKADLKASTKQLDLALEELLKLKPVCVDSGASWEERSARRKQEIEALKEALKILQETTFAFLSK